MSEQERLVTELKNARALRGILATEREAVAKLVLASPWLAAHDARIKAETLNEAAQHAFKWKLQDQSHADDRGFNDACDAIATDLLRLADRAKEETE